jgi:hypothetical protein
MVGLALTALLILAGGVNDLTFLPGYRLQFESVQPDLVNEGISDDSMRTIMAILRVLFIVGWVLLPFYIIYLIISPEARKKFLRDMMMIVPIIFILFFVMREPEAQEVLQNMDLSFQSQPLEEIVGTPVAPAEFSANPPDWLVTVASLLLAVLGTGLVVGVIYLYLRSRQPKAKPLNRIAFEAQEALDAIQSGGDLREVIIRCYFEMNKTVNDARSLKRGLDMTPREFELFLHERGLPKEPVHQLTQLFEQVRYGAFVPGRKEERIAVSSLSSIISACQRSR